MPTIVPTAEVNATLAKYGWDKGNVAFGNPVSEASVRLATSLALAGDKAKAAGKEFKHSWIMLDFDNKALEKDPEKGYHMGVASDDWNTISGGVATMPGLFVDGSLTIPSGDAVKLLAEKFPETDAKEQEEVLALIQHQIDFDASVGEVLKHFAWSQLHKGTGYSMVNKEHYSSYGYGVKDDAWAKGAVAKVAKFCQGLEDKLAARKEITGHFVGDHLTFADCVFVHLKLSLNGVAGLDIASKYPKLWAHVLKVKDLGIAGSEAHIAHFPQFCEYAAGANKDLREKGFDINNEKYWTDAK